MLNGGYINDAQVNGIYADDEGAYQQWLRNTGADGEIAHIVELGYHGGSAVYPSWVAYRAKLTDHANLCAYGYRERIKSVGSFSREISEDLSGEAVLSMGDVALDNVDGALDDWTRLSIDGQPVRVRWGHPSWTPDRFRIRYECLAEAVTKATQDDITIRLRGVEHGANLPLQTTLIPANTAANAPSNLPWPKAYGNVFNIKPTILDEANQVYTINDGAITSVSQVRDSGVRFNTNPIAISAVNTATDVISTATAHGFVAYTRVRCDLGSLPNALGGGYQGVAWNGRVFCAVGYASGSSATSPDGLNWTVGVMPSSSTWKAIAWNGTVFCAVAFVSTKAATSSDGSTWTASTLPSSQQWDGIAWNGSVFCAVASNSSVCATSADGVTWTSRSMPASRSWVGIAWNGSVFVALATATYAATSPDGITWTAQSMPVSATWAAIAWNGTVFCAVSNGSANAATSPDGITWTTRTLPSSASWTGIAALGSTFCTFAQGSTAAATSADGITWTARTLPASAANLWCAITANGYAFCITGTFAAEVTISPDFGATWSGVTKTLPSPLLNNTDYYVLADGLTTTDFKLATTRGGTVIDLTTSTTGAVIVGYHWTVVLTSPAKLYLDSKPAGELTCDAIAGTTLASSIVPTILGATQIDTRSQSRFASTCPQPVGYYAADRVNRLDAADPIMLGLGAWYGYNRYGLLQFGRIEASYSSHDFVLVENDFDDNILVLETMIKPRKRHRIGYRRNWTPQTGTLAAGVSAEGRNLYSQEYSSSPPQAGTDESADGSSEFHLLAVKPDVIPSMMAYGSDALAEAIRRDALYFGWVGVYSCRVAKIGSQLEPGMVGKVTHPRYGLSASVRMVLTKVTDEADGGTSLRFLRPLTNYTPGQI